MSLTTATDSPELTVSIGGASYSFSELPIAALAKLQSGKANQDHTISWL